MNHILLVLLVVGVAALLFRAAIRMNRKQEDDILGKI